MNSWEATPFKSIDEAYLTADKMRLRPSQVKLSGDYFSFTAVEGNEVYMIAQHKDGGPVRERTFPKKGKGRYKPPKEEGPHFSEQDRMLVGYWILTPKYDHLEGLQVHWLKRLSAQGDVEVLDVKLLRVKGTEYEFVKDREGMQMRVLHRRGFAGRDDFHEALAKHLFGPEFTEDQKNQITDACYQVLYGDMWKKETDGTD